MTDQELDEVINLPVQVELLKHQAEFMGATERFVALVGGFGCGKSRAIGYKAFMLSYINRGFDGMLVSRSGEQLHKLLIEVEAAFSDCGLIQMSLQEFRSTNRPMTYTNFGGRRYIINYGDKASNIYLSTTENETYKRWAGGNLAYVIIDEIDTMPKATEVWKFANDRVRVKAPLLQTACASTPEGYGFLYNFFDAEPRKDPSLAPYRKLIRGCTFDNPHLDTSYVRSQIQTRDPATLNAYVNGHFVNLDGSLVYYRFDKNVNITQRTLKDFGPHYICHVGLDFNKNVNAASVTFIDEGKLYTVHEFYGSPNIDMLIAEMMKVLRGRPIRIYPDASGFEGIQQLERAFGTKAVVYNRANPLVDRRVAAVNAKLATPEGIPTAFVNPNTCPHLYQGLMRQTRNVKGEPDKTQGLDHAVDGYGYMIWQLFPIGIGNNTATVVAGY